jgi:hypothetical protein
MRKQHTKQQKLIDIMFEIALTCREKSDWLENMTREDVASWVADQLRACGFDTKPCGSSWGVLR